MRSKTLTLIKLTLLLAGAAIFAVLVWQAGPRAIWDQLRGFGWGIGLFLVPALVMYLLDALAWRICFLNPGDVGFFRLFLVRTAGESLNATLPAAYLGGEPVKALLLKRAGVPGIEGLASVIVAKTALMVAQIILVVLGILAALMVGSMSGGNLPALLLGSCAVLAFGGWCIYMAYLGQRRGLGSILARFVNRFGIGKSWVEANREPIERFDRTLMEFYARDNRRFWIATAISLLAWLVEMAEVWIFAYLLGLPLGPLEILAIGALATVVKAAGFFIPASLGAQEGGNVLLFLAFGLNAVTGLTFSVLRRFRELVWIGLGLLLLASLGLPIRGGGAALETALAGPEPKTGPEPGVETEAAAPVRG